MSARAAGSHTGTAWTCWSPGRLRNKFFRFALPPPQNIILADEPTGNLDSKTSDEVIDLLKEASRKYSQTIVMITHNPEIAEQADRTIRIEDGRIAE